MLCSDSLPLFLSPPRFLLPRWRFQVHIRNFVFHVLFLTAFIFLHILILFRTAHKAMLWIVDNIHGFRLEEII